MLFALGFISGCMVALLLVAVEIRLARRDSSVVKKVEELVDKLYTEKGFVGEADEVMQDAESLIIGDEYDETAE